MIVSTKDIVLSRRAELYLVKLEKLNNCQVI